MMGGRANSIARPTQAYVLHAKKKVRICEQPETLHLFKQCVCIPDALVVSNKLQRVSMLYEVA